MTNVKFICPVCGCRTLDEEGGYDICPVCFWEDDGCRDERSERGINKGLTMLEARENLVRYGAFHEQYAKNTRKPKKSEITDTYIKLVNNH